MSNLNRIFISGGVISPNQLRAICETLLQNNQSHLSLGSRQDILVDLSIEELEEIPEIANGSFRIQPHSHNKNIVSSYLSSDIFDSHNWVKSSTYTYLLESFDYVPKLKINITDPNQTLVPSFGGDINVVSSEIMDYWHLYIRDNKAAHPQLYPVLVHSNHISKLCGLITKCWDKYSDITDLFEQVSSEADLDTRVVQKAPTLTSKVFPYYEGMHRYNIDQFWLGLYWRNNRYDIDFLIELCELCQKQEVTTICVTPWKSLIIRGIKKANKIKWEKLLGANGISVRHSQLEMNWHLPSGDNQALLLKETIVEQLNKKDISTYGLTIGIYKHLRQAFTSIVIIPADDSAVMRTVDIYHAKGFNPDHCNYDLYAQNIGTDNIPEVLIELSHLYYSKYLDLEQAPADSDSFKSELQEPTLKVTQCQVCLNVLDQELAKNESEDHHVNCSVCGAGKEEFAQIEMSLGEPIPSDWYLQ